MANQPTYKHLGSNTVVIRIPHNIKPQLLQLVRELDSISERHSVEYVDTILERIIAGLENVP